MSRRPAHKPVDKPTQEGVCPWNRKPNLVKPFGLSDEQFARVTRAMRAVARLVNRHSGVSPEDAVQQAWLKALSKPELEGQSIDDFEKFVMHMCTLAKYESMTNRQSHVRRQRREVASDIDIAEMVAVPHSLEAVEARKILEGPFMALEPAEQELLHALYHEGKTIEELKIEKNLAWTTVDSRRQRLLKLLYAAIRAMVTALLLVPKKARAFVAQVAQQGPQFASTMAVTAVCGVLLPTGSSFTTESSTLLGLTLVDNERANSALSAGLQPSFVAEVEPEEPSELDATTNTCSTCEMKSTNFASFMHKTVGPAALVLAPALAQVACAGSNTQTPCAQQPEEEEPDGSLDPYEMYRVKARARGETVLTREEFER